MRIRVTTTEELEVRPGTPSTEADYAACLLGFDRVDSVAVTRAGGYVNTYTLIPTEPAH